MAYMPKLVGNQHTPHSWDTGSAVKGSTARRPVLNTAGAGQLYFDTTLAAAGKPVFWTGAAWVDATGAPV